MFRKKYTIWFLFLLSMLCIFFCTSCQKRQTAEKESLFNEPSVASTESDPEAMKNYNYGKTFSGGTGFVKEENRAPYYEYTGGNMKIEVVIDNGGDAFECGVSLVLDGISQTFTLTDQSGNTTDAGLMHIIQMDTQKSYTLTLEFTPNTGKKGDILNIAIGTMLEPSYMELYSGYGSYGKYRQHSLNVGSDVTIHMMVDAPTQQSAATLNTAHVEVPESYRAMFRSAENEDRWGTDYKAELYTDIQMVADGISLLRVPAGKTANLTLDVFGIKADWRASLFVNHQLVEFDSGCTYFDFSTDSSSVTRVTLPVDISALPENNHAYVVLYHKSAGNPNMADGTYVYADRIGTYYFIVDSTDKAN